MSNKISDANDSKGEPKFKYLSAPEKKPSLSENNKLVPLISNYIKITFSQNEYKLCIYDVSVEPELAKDNYSLYSLIQRQIEGELNKYFPRKFFSGYNLFASSNNPQSLLVFKTIVENKEFSVTLKLTGEMEMNELNILKNFEGENQRKKSVIERIIKDIILKNRNTIKFGDDGTIVKITTKSVSDFGGNQESKDSIYKGYYTSAQITENGLFLLVLSVNKYVRNITVYEKIKELRKEKKNLEESNIRNFINDYFRLYPTVLATYGSLRTYRIGSIDFDKSPAKTCFNIKDEGKLKTITVSEYYKIQYNINIQDLNQPLIIAENKAKRKKLQETDNSGNINLNKIRDDNQQERIIYLIPELVYITGNPIENEGKNRRALITKTKVTPNEKMKEIKSIINPKSFECLSFEEIANYLEKKKNENSSIIRTYFYFLIIRLEEFIKNFEKIFSLSYKSGMTFFAFLYIEKENNLFHLWLLLPWQFHLLPVAVETPRVRHHQRLLRMRQSRQMMQRIQQRLKMAQRKVQQKERHRRQLRLQVHPWILRMAILLS